MKFDTVIIGGGLAGVLRAETDTTRPALRHYQPRSERTAFSSGSLDLLGALPDGTPVNAPLATLSQPDILPSEHPYSLIGSQPIARLVHEAEALLATCGARLQGNAHHNHQRYATWDSAFSLAKPEEVPVALSPLNAYWLSASVVFWISSLIWPRLLFAIRDQRRYSRNRTS
jgi:glycerol-3-phosphate dehydrogenase subunit B